MPKPKPLLSHLTDKKILEIAEDEIPYALEYLKGASYDAHDSALAELINFAHAVIAAAAPAPPAPEPGEVGELLAALGSKDRWMQLSDAQLDRAATLLQQQQHLLTLAGAESKRLVEQQAAPAPEVVPVPKAERLPGVGGLRCGGEVKA